MSIISMPILTTLLSPSAYGVAALFGTAISLGSVFALAGADVSYARAYHSKAGTRGIDAELYCWRFALRSALVLSLVCSAGWWFGHRASRDASVSLTALLGIGLVLSVMNTMAQTRARLAGRYRAMAVVVVSTGLICTATSIAIAKWWRADAVAILLPMTVGYALQIIVLGTPSVKALAGPQTLIKEQGRALIMTGLAAVVTAPMYWVLSSSDRWFLHFYQGPEAVGIYSIACSVGVAGMMLNTAVMAVWLPEASREYETHPQTAAATLGRLMFRLTAMMALVWVAIVAAGGDVIRWLADDRFHGAAQYLPYIAAGVFFYGVSQLALARLVLINQFKWAAAWWIAGGFVCIALNVALVDTYGAFGAAVTQAVSFAFVCAGVSLTADAKLPVPMFWTRMLVLGALTLSCGVMLAPPWHVLAPLSLIMKLPFGLGIAALAAWVAAPDWWERGVTYVTRRQAA